MTSAQRIAVALKEIIVAVMELLLGCREMNVNYEDICELSTLMHYGKTILEIGACPRKRFAAGLSTLSE